MARKITHIVVHCTAASGDQPTQNILQYWRRKGWKTNGYHWLVDANGLAVRLMGDEFSGNGVRGHNKTAIHVCYKGGWNGKDTRTQEQKGMLKMILEEYRKKYPTAIICGHRDMSKDLDGDGIIEQHEWVKLCPCFNAKAEYKHI
jgi:N-acetylmuramoyl-L-alanine amidase